MICRKPMTCSPPGWYALRGTWEALQRTWIIRMLFLSSRGHHRRAQLSISRFQYFEVGCAMLTYTTNARSNHGITKRDDCYNDKWGLKTLIDVQNNPPGLWPTTCQITGVEHFRRRSCLWPSMLCTRAGANTVGTPYCKVALNFDKILPQV